ncbi:hypothetical protein BT69DRAFT_1256863 [Atractiella rhizophila]|nr:hypothetical protein BT69DRAFT_1256863 [Atractiella rhizophila]
MIDPSGSSTPAITGLHKPPLIRAASGLPLPVSTLTSTSPPSAFASQPPMPIVKARDHEVEKVRKKAKRRSSSVIKRKKRGVNEPVRKEEDDVELGHMGGSGTGKTLIFAPDSWKVRLKRWGRKVFYASTPSDSLQNTLTADSTSYGSSDWEDKQYRKSERLKEEDEDQEWKVDNVVVDSNYDEITSRAESTRDDSESRSVTGGQPAHSEISESLGRVHYWRTWRALAHHVNEFFNPKFDIPEWEEKFQKERWHTYKFFAWFACAFLIVNWILYLILNHSHTLYEKIAYYGIGTALTVPLPFLIAANGPRKHPMKFQVLVMFSSWFWGVSEVIEIYECHFFPNHKACHGKDFLFMMTYSIALPTLALFSFNQKRFFYLFGATVQFLLICILILPRQKIFTRNGVSFVLFVFFFSVLHYLQEQVDRRGFSSKTELARSWRAQQRAQIAERAAADSKKKFVSYIFHEVRVPLNSAMLAFQNLEVNDVFKHCLGKDQEVEVHALLGSLKAMKTVLDDVLDFNRMDAGKFISNPAPFHFHRSIEAMLGTLKSAASAKNLKLHIDFDERIDKVVSKRPGQEKGAMVVGDVMRLRQVITNLTSNAAKFTPEGKGSIRVKTELIYPTPEHPHPPGPEETQEEERKGIQFLDAGGESSLLTRLNLATKVKDFAASASAWTDGGEEQEQRMVTASARPEDGVGINDEVRRSSMIVKISVTDAGPGIRPSDLHESKLFSPYSQARLGRESNTGSGLGLAIVRQIVTLMGGRLGVKSQRNSGSTFWVEFMYRLATKEEVERQRQLGKDSFLPYTLEEDDATTPNESPLTNRNTSLPSPPFPSPVFSRASTTTMTNTTDPNDSQADLLSRMRIVEEPSQAHEKVVEREKADIELRPLTPPLAVHLPHRPHSEPIPPDVPPNEVEVGKLVVKRAGSGGSDREILSAGAPERQPTTPTPAVQKLQVLVVDDDPLTRTLMSRMLTKLGCEVTQAEDGKQAYDLLMFPKYFDMVTLDNMMPVMTGEQTIKKLRSMGRTDFVVGATGNALREDQTGYIKAGANQVLTKPVLIKDVKAMLQIAQSNRGIHPCPQPTFDDELVVAEPPTSEDNAGS